MKKILFLLLFTVSIYGQTLQNPTYGTVTVKNSASDTTPAFIVTSQTDGVYKKTASAIFAKTEAVQDSLDKKLNISDLPTNLTLYPTNVASDVSGYVVMVKDIHDVRYNTTAVDISTPAITTTDQLVSSRIADAGTLIGQPGVFNVTAFGNIRRLSGTGTATFYFRVYHRDASGIETLIGQSSDSEVVTSSSYLQFTSSMLWDDGSFDATDRIVVKTYSNRIAGGSDPVYQFQFGGTSPVRLLLPVPFSVVDAGYELKDNKQNSLAVDGTGQKFPTVDAVIAGLDLKVDKITNTRIVDAFTYGFSPSATGEANSIAINNALALGGKIIVSIPGVYEIDDTIILPSNTTIEFVKGCTLKHVTPATGRFVNTFKNKGCIDSTPNDNISIIGNGLNIDFNGHDGIEGGVSIPFSYQNGRISFYKVTNFNISGIYVNDPQDTYGMYFLQTTNCAFGKINDIELKRYPKDGIDMIHSNNIHIKNYRSTTGDDAIFIGSGWLGYDKSVGDTYNITIENWISDGIFRGVPSRIITNSWDNWTNGRTYAGSSEDASELCVNAGRVYRKTTNGNQTASIAPTHSTGTVIGADGIGWLVVSNTVKYTNDVYNIRYINCQVINSSSLAHWYYESPTVSQNTHTAMLKDVYFDNCSFISDSGTKTVDYGSFINASANISNLNISNTEVSFKENTSNVGYNSFITFEQNSVGNKVNIDNVNIDNVKFDGTFLGNRFIETKGNILELGSVNILNSHIKTNIASGSSIVLVSNKDNLNSLNIANSKIEGIEGLLFFAGSNWTPPIERTVNVVNTTFDNCKKIFTHQYSYPLGMNINYNSFGCEFLNTTDWILENAADPSMVILNFVGNKNNTPSKILENNAQYVKKIFDLELGLAIVKDEIINGVTTVAPSQNAVFDALSLKQNNITNPITGSLTNGYIPRSGGVNSLVDGLIYDNISSVGIGTTSPFRKLTLENTGSVYLGINDSSNNKYSIGSDGNGLVFFDDTHGRYMANFDATTGAFIIDGNATASSIKISSTPSTSAGTYDILTRNSSTGVVEKVANIVSQTITNGVTTTAPSEDAVYDALALKASLAGEQTFTSSISATDFIGNWHTTASTGTGLRAPNNGGITFVCNHPSTPGWTANTNITATFYKSTVYTVATLPTTGVASGTYATVSDATAPTYLGALTGGGSVVCPVFYNGTAWVSH